MLDSRKEKYQVLTKQQNKKQVLQTIWRYSPISRSDIAKTLSMNKSTVSNLVNDLAEEELIVSVGNRSDGVGRSSSLLMLNDKFGYVVGILITTVDVQVVISDLYTKTLWETFCPVEKGNTMGILDKIGRLIKRGLSECGIKQEQVLGVGISVPSIVESSTGFVYANPFLNLYNLPVGEYFRTSMQIPVFVNSIAINSARAEKWLGDSQCKNVACVEISRGVGLGLIIDGCVFVGSRGFAGADVSHMSLLPHGPLCTCGRRGCWETLGSMQALGKRSIEDVVALADDGDSEAIKQLSGIGRYIGLGVANIIKIVNPDKVVISGPITAAKSWVFNSIISTLRKSLWPHVFSNIKITYSSINANGSPSIIGALMSVIETVID